MNNKQLADALRPWIRVDTWHSCHPLDQKRFHHSLKTAIDAFGLDMSYGDFEQAINLLVDEYYPDKITLENRADIVEFFASQAEHIVNFLKNTAEETA